MGGGKLRVGDDAVQVYLVSGSSGVIRMASLSGRGVWRRSGLFRFVRICSGLFGDDLAWEVAPGVRGWMARGEVGIDRTFVLLGVW